HQRDSLCSTAGAENPVFALLIQYLREQPHTFRLVVNDQNAVDTAITLGILDRLHQIVRREWTLDETECSHFGGTVAVITERDDDYGDVKSIVTRFQLAENTPSLSIGKIDIHDDDRRVQPTCHRLGFQRN